MDGTTALLLFGGAAALIALAAVAWLIYLARKRRSHTVNRDDLQRAGSSADRDAESAANKAVGSNSWMRPSGGGL